MNEKRIAMKRLLSLILICLVGFTRLTAENILFYDSKQLTCDLITSICQDKDGFIWIGTDYGLNKFNGLQFTHYYNNPKDSTSLLDNSVKTLLLDREGTLWVGSVGGLQYYLPEENAFRRIDFDEDIPLHVKKLVQLRSGDIWVASSGRGIFCIPRNEKIAVRITDIPGISDYLHYGAIYEDREGYIWIGVDNVGLLRYHPVTRQSKMYTKDDINGASIISCMTEDSAGTLLVATAVAACYYDREHDKFIDLKHNENWLPARSVLTSKDGTSYVATYGKGLKVVSPDLAELYPESISLPFFDLNYAKIPVIYEDRDMNLWVGCYHKGVVMLSKEPTPFHFWSVPQREYPSASVVTAIAKDVDGNILGAVEGGGVFQFNSKGNLVRHLFENQTFSSLYKDQEDNLWFGGRYSGIFMKEPNGRITPLFPEIKYKDIRDIMGDDKNNLYFSVYGDGFMQYHVPTRTVTNYKSSSTELKNNWINSFIYSSKELLWIGHCYGIDCFDPQTKKFEHLSAEFSGFITYSLLEDVKGNIWAGTNKGLLCCNPSQKTLKHYAMEDGLSNNFVYGLVEDEHGNIWCSTLKGINLVNVDENRIVSYYSERGLVDNEYMPGASFQSMDGMIYLGGIKGVTYFHPDSIVQQQKQLEVILSNIYLGGKIVTTGQKSGNRAIIETVATLANDIHLAYEDNTFMLEFSTFDYKSVDNIFYEYRIREYGEEWTATQPGVNQITYNHLNSGDYTFEVRACENGQYSSVKVLRISIAAPWWRSSLAYVCYVLIFLVVVFQIYLSVRRRHQKEMSEERIKLFINLSHEIRSPMTLIVSPLENLLKRDYDADTMKMLRLMQKNANRIINLMNQLLDMRKIEKGQLNIHCVETDMVDYIKELISLFTYQAEKRNINLHFDYEQEELPAWIDPNNFDKVLVNLLSNAFKYTPDGGEIRISLREKSAESITGDLQHCIEIEVTDSGTGIDANKLEKIFERFYQAPSNGSNGSIGFGIGLNLCRMIVKLHHGSISACNRQDAQGSRFIIHIPYGKEHLKKAELADTENKTTSRIPSVLEHSHESEEEVAKTRYHKANYKIVIVDDDDEILRFLEAELSSQYKVYVCRNGKEGLQTILKQQPDMIISDVVMPEMDGISLLKTVRNNPNVSHIPFILLTSKAKYKDRIEGLSKGADVYLGKPFVVEELRVHIKNLIETRLLLKGKFSGVRDQVGKIEIAENKSGDERLMERVMNVVNKFLDDSEFNVEMLAREVGLSRVQLHRKMKDITGVSTSIFIRNLRMKKAAALLQEGKLNISEIADAVGFDNQANFATVFKKFYGVSPSEYAASIRNKNE